jgi:hypothetical protein
LQLGLRDNEKAITPGAQTERRGGAWAGEGRAWRPEPHRANTWVDFLRFDVELRQHGWRLHFCTFMRHSGVNCARIPKKAHRTCPDPR